MNDLIQIVIKFNKYLIDIYFNLNFLLFFTLLIYFVNQSLKIFLFFQIIDHLKFLKTYNLLKY